MKKITILLPVYNVEKYIKKCIESLLQQTFDDFNILIISDGSTDKSIEIAESFSDSRITILRKENGGYGSVIEFALTKITTEYFMICDPDDWMDPSAIETIQKVVENNDVDIVTGDFYKVLDDKISLSKIQPEHYHLDENKLYTDLTLFTFSMRSPHSKLYRTSKLSQLVFPRKVAFTDELLYLYAVSVCDSAIYLGLPLSYYLFDRPGNSNSLKENYYLKSLKQHIIVADSVIEQVMGSKYMIPIFYRVLTVLQGMRKVLNKIEKSQKRYVKPLLKSRINYLRKYRFKYIKFIKKSTSFKTLITKIMYFFNLI